MYICNDGGYGSSFDYIIIVLFLVVFKSKESRSFEKNNEKKLFTLVGFYKRTKPNFIFSYLFYAKKQPGIMISLKNRQMCMGWVCIFKGSFFVRKKRNTYTCNF